MTVAGVLKLIHRAFPWGKKFLPFPLFQYVMRGFFSDESCFVHLARRRWMRDVMMPSLRHHSSRAVFFVGCAPYTWHYERVFEGSGPDYITIDPMPAARVWGSTRHIVDRVQRLDKYVDPGTVDVVVMVGVYGFGVNTSQDLRETLESIRGVLKEGGVLVLGWYSDTTPDPAEHPSLDDLFVASGYHDLLPRKQCNETLTVDI